MKTYYFPNFKTQVQIPNSLNGPGTYKGCNKLPARKVGHGGTLDPLATGVMVIGIGKATRSLKNLLEGSKEYRVIGKLGVITDTWDITGNQLQINSTNHITLEMIKELLPNFEGTYNQVPPIFSALKHQGQRLYSLAREKNTTNITYKPDPRQITCNSIKLLGLTRNEEGLFLELLVNCEKGFYIRSLINEIGEKLGCGATVYELERTRLANFFKKDSLILEEVKNLDKLKENLISY